MPRTYYYTVNNEVISEVTDGVRLDYLTDALGSVTAKVDQNCNVVSTARYKPYGDLLAGTQYKLGWVGTLGYRKTGLKYSGEYIRARHYSLEQGQWTTRDPLWPVEVAYSYSAGNVAQLTDRSGMKSGPINLNIDDSCRGKEVWINVQVNIVCANLTKCYRDPSCLARYMSCMHRHNSKCPTPQETFKCMVDRCNGGSYKVECHRLCVDEVCGATTCARTYFNGKCLTVICSNFGAVRPGFDCDAYSVWMHEMSHCCGTDDGKADTENHYTGCDAYMVSYCLEKAIR